MIKLHTICQKIDLLQFSGAIKIEMYIDTAVDENRIKNRCRHHPDFTYIAIIT